jgi:ribosomal protein S12
MSVKVDGTGVTITMKEPPPQYSGRKPRMLQLSERILVARYIPQSEIVLQEADVAPD